MTTTNSARNAGALNLVFGLWMIISPFVLMNFSDRAMWNNIILGAIVFILAGARLSQPGMSGASVINALLGIWVLISPFVLAFGSAEAYWNNIVLGILILLAGLYGSSTQPTAPTPPGP